MIYLDKEKVKKLIEHAKAESPSEACGLLAGLAGREKKERREVKKVYKITNTDKARETFFMDSKEQFKAMKEIRNSGLEMVGIYHSHPHTKAYPSKRDVKLTYYPDASQVIISLKDAANPVLRSFSIVDGKIEEESVEIKGETRYAYSD